MARLARSTEIEEGERLTEANSCARYAVGRRTVTHAKRVQRLEPVKMRTVIQSNPCMSGVIRSGAQEAYWRGRCVVVVLEGRGS